MGGECPVVTIPLEIYHFPIYSYIFRVIRTPAQRFTLGSPISLSPIPLKSCTLDEYEAAESLLSLFTAPLKSLHLPFEDDNMDVALEIQLEPPILADLDSESIMVPDTTPISQLLLSGDNLQVLKWETILRNHKSYQA